MYRIVSNNSNFKVKSYSRGRGRIPLVLKDRNREFPPLFRAQEKNVFGAWQDISPLFSLGEMKDWVVGQGFETEDLYASGAEGLQFFGLKKSEPKRRNTVILDPRGKGCPDCGVGVGDTHFDGCDVERCPGCGGQLLMCGLDCTPDDKEQERLWEKRSVWTGLWPGVAECREFGWYSYFTQESGWVQTTKDDPRASENLNRLYEDAQWDKEQQRFVLKPEPPKQEQPNCLSLFTPPVLAKELGYILNNTKARDYDDIPF